MEALRKAFENKNKQGSPALITFVTAGYPKVEDTVPIMLAMQEGGADIIELGVPFSDPMADGPAIQETNVVALNNGTDYAQCLGLLRDARRKGLTAPVLLMGYYNPLIAYGEEKAVQDASEAASVSYVPLVAPSTSLHRIEFLASIADSFIYIVSKMGTTGSSVTGTMNTALPDLINRVREYTDVPLAVGFGVATRQHFDLIADAGADGVVIGSRLVSIVKNAPQGEVAKSVEAYCREISLKGQPQSRPSLTSHSSSSRSHASTHHTPSHEAAQPTVLPPRFGQFGGQYVPEALWDCLIELEEAHQAAMKDPEFWKEFESFYNYMNRPSNLYKAEKLTEHAGGANIWLKREDLNHTGSHKINTRSDSFFSPAG
ncbi:Tryptophan synthase [Grifola frondosa]|uniref:tryptophan synthase n=1 Tax=Grifola frondosa TaxID=5627 RepID=A0A1C7MEZ4_GRIFR|nr:Tryptophan synthase [Grifola frondosa]